jgi:hypothetical protein
VPSSNSSLYASFHTHWLYVRPNRSSEQLEVIAPPVKNAAKHNPKAAHIDGTYVPCLLSGDKYHDSVV